MSEFSSGSDDLLDLIQGRIESPEYVRRVKARVDAQYRNEGEPMPDRSNRSVASPVDGSANKAIVAAVTAVLAVGATYLSTGEFNEAEVALAIQGVVTVAGVYLISNR